MMQTQLDELKCKHCGSGDLVPEDIGFIGLADKHSEPRVFQWLCLDCDKTMCTLEYACLD